MHLLHIIVLILDPARVLPGVLGVPKREPGCYKQGRKWNCLGGGKDREIEGEGREGLLLEGKSFSKAYNCFGETER